MNRFEWKLSKFIMGVILTLWLSYYLTDFVKDEPTVHNIEIKLNLMEEELVLRKNYLKNLSNDVELIDKNYRIGSKGRDQATKKNIYRKINEECEILESSYSTSKVDIQMLDLYKNMTFQNEKGSDWTQGWKLNYKLEDFNTINKLKVFVVPHSHNDPGWLRTYDEYYDRVTKYILWNAINFLSKHHDMKFIWAEISFFSRWYESLSNGFYKDQVKQLVNRGQLEFVTGGWVMPDEANSHWLGITIQLIEGQNWLKKHLNVVPKSAWAIDPFGHSATMAYLLKNSNIKNMLIQRTHYEVKKRLAQDRLLEFRWRQIWDKTGNSEMFTHMMPFVSYSAPYSCGPDPMICCQFDFERLPNKGGRSCKWGVQPEQITEENLPEKAHLLLDQWRKKSILYKTKSLLIPLGDDFRYSHSIEWTDQYENYKKLFNYLNKQDHLRVEAKFATLGEYFKSVHKENHTFPSLSGDFFTYSDQDDHYWSGYYTSRPYYKRMDRVLIHYLRSAEMMLSWNKWKSNKWLERKLRNATQALSLFQHHDGITGTAREHVMEDYARMLNYAIRSCKFVMQQAAFRMLTKPEAYKPDYKRTYFNLDESHWPGLEDENRQTLVVNKETPEKFVAFHNSLPQWREEIVELQVSTPYVKVTDPDNEEVVSQISPTWTWNKLFYKIVSPQARMSAYILNFKVKIPPLGISTYIISLASKQEATRRTYANITILAQVPFFVDLWEYPLKAQLGKPIDFNLKMHSFTKNGFLKLVSSRDNYPQTPVHLEFLKYGTKSWFADERSGAYLFLPDGPATVFPVENPTVVISSGVLESHVTTGLSFAIHKTILRDDTLEIRNYVDIREMSNKEVVMRLTTTIYNNETFYTDLNGLQILKRLNFQKLPLQANYYPVPSSIYIEDELSRITLLTAQPLGGSSLTSGQIDIMQDRRLKQSDGRGLGEGVLDNRPVQNIFRLIVESRSNCFQNQDSGAGSLTVHAHQELQKLLHPIDKLIFRGKIWAGRQVVFGQQHQSLDSDFEIGMLQRLPQIYQDSSTKAQHRLGLILHRVAVDKCDNPEDFMGKVDISKLLNLNDEDKIFRSSLTFVEKSEKLTGGNATFCPMDMKAFIIQR